MSLDSLWGGMFEFPRIPHYKKLIGYSWKTNQYGLSINTVTAFEHAKPDGNVAIVTKASHADLFFGLKVCLFQVSAVNL